MIKWLRRLFCKHRDHVLYYYPYNAAYVECERCGRITLDYTRRD